MQASLAVMGWICVLSVARWTENDSASDSDFLAGKREDVVKPNSFSEEVQGGGFIASTGDILGEKAH